MAFRRRFRVLLFLFFLLVGSSTSTRNLKTVKNGEVSVRNFQHQEDAGELMKMERLLEGRMNLELNDYPGTGANNNHDPSPPGKRV